MAEKRADYAEGDADHDNQRLCVTAERNGEHGVNRQQRERKRDLQTVHAFAHVRAVTFEARAEAVVFLHQLRQNGHLDVGDDIACLASGRDVGGGVNDAPSVAAVNRGIGAATLDRGDFSKGHVDAGLSQDHQVIDRLFRRAVLFRQPDHHLDLVAAPLLAKHLGPVERAAHLAGHLARRQAETLAFGLDDEVELLFPRLEAVVNVFDAGVGADAIGELGAGALEYADIAVTELHVQGAAVAAGSARVGGEFEIFHPRHISYRFSPAIGEFLRAHDLVADIRLGEFHAHAAVMAAIPAHVGDDLLHQFLVAALGDDVARASDQPLQDGFGLGDG